MLLTQPIYVPTYLRMISLVIDEWGTHAKLDLCLPN